MSLVEWFEFFVKVVVVALCGTYIAVAGLVVYGVYKMFKKLKDEQESDY